MELVTIVFLVLLFLGMPVGFAVGIAGATFFLQHPELPLITMVQLPISQTQNVTLLAVPLFIFAGTLMNASGITSRMVKLAMLLAGHMRGGMAQVSVVLSTLMGGCSGSTNADAAMEARILGPEMERQGYPKAFTAVVIGFTALITSTIPPGIGMILYGTVGQVSIGRLFAAGLTSGLILMGTLMIGVAIMSRIRHFSTGTGTARYHQGHPWFPEGDNLGADIPLCSPWESADRYLHSSRGRRDWPVSTQLSSAFSYTRT